MRQGMVRRSNEETTVRIGSTMSIPAVLRSLGVDPAEVLAEAGFDLRLFDNPDNQITYAARGRLLSHCVARTGCRHFGLLVGQQGGLYGLGLLGFLAQNSPDVQTALQSLIRFLHLHVQGAAADLVINGEQAVFGYNIYQPHVEASEQICDGAVAVMFNIMIALCGPGWQPTQILFAHRKPKDVKPYRQFFRAPLFFDADQNALVFSTSWLSCRLSGANSELHRLLQKQIEALVAKNRHDFTSQVRCLLCTAIKMGHDRAELVAELLSMSPRTLSRRLNASGTSFHALADECRFEIARQLLETSEMNVGRIADALNYADASAFTRAFRRWCGITPARWRAMHDREPG